MLVGYIVTSTPFSHQQPKRAVGYTKILLTASEKSGLPCYEYHTCRILFSLKARNHLHHTGLCKLHPSILHDAGLPMGLSKSNIAYL